MKITKDRLRELIKEELAELEQEAKTTFLSTGEITGAEAGYGRGTSSPSSQLDNVSLIFHSLLNPIIWQGRTNEPNNDWIKQLVDKKTKGMKPEQIEAAIKQVQDLADSNRQKVIDSEELLKVFNATVDKIKSQLQQKTQPVPQVTFKMDESKIKITFRKK